MHHFSTDIRLAHVTVLVETHLTKDNIRDLKRIHQKEFSLDFSAPALIPDSGIPLSMGLAVIAKKPFFVRPEINNITDGKNIGRAMSTLLFLGDYCIRIISLYAFFEKDNAIAKAKNDVLFTEIGSFLRKSLPLPTFFMGDFNCEANERQSLEWLQALGFFDVALVQSEWTKEEPRPTTGSKNRIDFIFANVKALDLFQSLTVEGYATTGHLPLELEMRIPANLPTYTVWGRKSPLRLSETQINDLRQCEYWTPITAAKSASIRTQLEFLTNRCSSAISSYAIEASLTDTGNLKKGAHHPLKALPGKTVLKRRMTDTAHPAFCSPVEKMDKLARQLQRISNLLFELLCLLKKDDREVQCFRVIHALDTMKIQKLDIFQWALRNMGYVTIPKTWDDTFAWSHLFEQIKHFAKQHCKLLVQMRTQLKHKSVAKDFDQHCRALHASLRPDSHPPISAMFITEDTITGSFARTKRLHGKQKVTASFHPSDTVLLQEGQQEVLIGDHLYFSRFVNGHFMIQVRHDFWSVTSIHTGHFSSCPNKLTEFLARDWIPVWNPMPIADDYWNNWFQTNSFLFSNSKPLQIQISIEDWHWGVRHYKKHTAHGVDNFSASELCAIPDSYAQLFIEIWNDMISRGIGWPTEYMYGLVTLLAKKHDARRGRDFRPITVFPLLYRLWSKILLRHTLKWISTWVHPSVHGFLKGKQVEDVTYALSMRLEQAFQDNQIVSGAVFDITKCFNAMYWYPFIHGLVKYGFPQGVADSWLQSLQRLTRSIKIHDCYGPKIRASIGFPEGDPLSIAPAILLGHWFALFLEHNHGALICPGSFADNLEFSTDDITELIPAYQTVQMFATGLKLSLDAQKSWCWTSNNESRRQLRMYLLEQNIQCQVLLHARDLGVHVSYCRAIYNSTFATRLTEAHRRLQVLIAKKHPWEVTIRALRSNIFSVGLWGCESTFFSKERMTKLRADVVKALRLNKAQRSTDLALAMAGFHTDPLFEVMWKRLSFFHRYCKRYPAFDYQEFIARGATTYRQGIFNLLRSSLLEIQAILLPTGHISTPDESISIKDASLNQLWLFTSRAWEKRLHLKICKRKGLFDSPMIDWNLTLKCFSKVPYIDQSIIRILCSLGYTTSQQNHHWKTDTRCPVCQGPETVDSIEHRMQCPKLSSFNSCYSEIIHWFLSQPTIVRRTGIILKHFFYPRFVEYLHSIQLPQFAKINSTPSQPANLFTDGSASQSKFPFFRLSSGAIFNADNQTCVGQFQTPGLIQTVPRAELLAVYLSMLYCDYAHIYSDSKVTVDGWYKLCQNPEAFLRVAENSDIWRLIHALFPNSDFHRYKLFKVKSHVTLSEKSSAYEKWCKHNNDFADDFAKLANLARPSDILDNLQLALENIKDQLQSHVSFYQYFAKLNTQVSILSSKNEQPPAPPEELRISPTSSVFFALDLPQSQDLVPYFGYNAVFLRRVLCYLSQLRWSSKPIPACEMQTKVGSLTIIELTLDYMFATKTWPPVKITHPDRSIHFRFVPDVHDFPCHLTLKQATDIMADALLQISLIWGQEILPGLITRRFRSFSSRNQKKSPLRLCWHANGCDNQLEVKPFCSMPILLCPTEVRSLCYTLRTSFAPRQVLQQNVPNFSNGTARLHALLEALSSHPGESYWRANASRKRQRQRAKLDDSILFKCFSNSEQLLIQPASFTEVSPSSERDVSHS